jgi:hypothetical protein
MDNRQAIGYMLLACKRLGYTKERTRELFGEMYYLFDIYTEEEAEEKGFDWYHSLEESQKPSRMFVIELDNKDGVLDCKFCGAKDSTMYHLHNRIRFSVVVCKECLTDLRN